MGASFTFSCHTAGDAIALAKVVKPETGDLCLRFDEEQIVVFSYDKRRYVRSIIKYNLDKPKNFRQEELFLATDKTALLESSDLDHVTVSFAEKSVSLKAEGGGHSRHASMKRRSKKSRRPPVPAAPTAPILFEDRPGLLGRVLGQLACSAQVKLKSDEEMRVNQVHFYGERGYAVSMSRHFMTVVKIGFGLDVSIVGADIPAMRGFCDRLEETDRVCLRQDDRYLYLELRPMGSVLALSRVSAKRPELEVVDNDAFSNHVVIDHDQLTKSSSWASLTSKEEGTSRVNFAVEDGSKLVLRFGSEVVSTSDCALLQGKPFDVDLHIGQFSWIAGHVGGKVRLMFGSSQYPTLMCIRPEEQDPAFQVHHYLQSMRK